MAYYTELPEPRTYSHSDHYRQPLPVRPRVDHPRLVHRSEKGREHEHAHFDPSREILPHRHSDLILPSIEGSFSHAPDQQMAVPDLHQRVNTIKERQWDGREPLQQHSSSLVHVDDDGDSSRVKRRKVYDQYTLNEQNPSRMLIPLDNREGHSSIAFGPSAAVSVEDTAPFVLDKRIVQLPPRQAKRYGAGQSRIQNLPQLVDIENQPVHRMPRQQENRPVANSERFGGPRSPRKSSAFHPSLARKSPVSSKVPTRLYHHIPEPQFSSLKVSVTNEERDQVYPESHVINHPPQHYESMRGQVQRDFSKLAIDPKSHRDYDFSVNLDEQPKFSTWDSSHTPALAYMPARHEEDMRADNNERRQRSMLHPNSSIFRGTQQPLLNETNSGYADKRLEMEKEHSYGPGLARERYLQQPSSLQRSGLQHT